MHFTINKGCPEEAYKREIERLKFDIKFLDAVIDGQEEREKRLRSMLKMAVYHRQRAQKRLCEALAVLKNGGELCELCRHGEFVCDEDYGCPECREKCACKFCENGSKFEFKEDKDGN